MMVICGGAVVKPVDDINSLRKTLDHTWGLSSSALLVETW